MNLHLLWDEKIANRIIDTFETVFPGKNYYIVWRYNDDAKRFVKQEGNVSIVGSQSEISICNSEEIDKVIVHGLDIKKITFIETQISRDIPVFWILWGAELYNALVGPHGFKLYYKNHLKSTFRSRVGSALKRIGFKSKTDLAYLNFLASHDVTMVCAREEYDILRRYFPKETRNLKNESSFFYYPIDAILGKDLMDKEVDGNIILAGNSASFTNNHDYVFKYLKDLNLRDFKIVMPLSYGGSPEYINHINAIGKKLFGEKYIGLKDFLPLSDYNRLMLQAKVCIYGSWRQEAVGNIIIALYLGAKVFLPEKSPLFSIYRKRGIIIFSLENITEETLHTPLNAEERMNNRRILIETNNWERLQSITHKIFG